MQGLAADVPEVGIVEKVPGKGMADIFHMDTDLVGASCLKTETQERQIRVFIIQKPFIPGGRGLSVVRVRDPLDGRALLPPDGDGDRSAGICFPTDSGQIFPADLPALHLAGEKGGAEPVFCHQEKAGRVFIQTIDRPEHEGFLFLSEIVRQAIGQGIAVVSLGGVDGHSSGLVYHQEVCILLQDVQVHGNGLHSCGALFFRNTYLELVSVLQHAG